MSDRQVRAERSGWRDLGLSTRHRKWGFDVPACDVDFINFIEYDNKKSVALVEYKSEFAAPCLPKDANRLAIVDLANKARLPAFGVRYASDYRWWNVVPLNKEARSFLLTTGEMMDEGGYINFLYRLRGRTPPPSVLGQGQF